MNQQKEYINHLFIKKNAIKYFNKLKIENNLSDEYSIRIEAKGALGAPFEYALRFEKIPKKNDLQLLIDGLKVILDPESAYNLKHCIIDYIDNGTEKGFIFNNPNQTKSCGGSCNCSSQ